MSIEKKCENCIYGKNKNSFFGTCEEDITYCYHFTLKEELVREDERNKIYKLLSKVCLQDNVKYGFQLDGKDYLITRVGHIDTFEKMIRDEERNKIITLLKEDLRDYKTLREEYKDDNDLQLEDTALIIYINDLIDTIKN